jgi:hypothetical protein
MLIMESFLEMCQFQLADFATEGLTLLRIVNLPFVNMLTNCGVQFFTFRILQSVC